MKFNVWTLLFQIINFIVLFFILKRILYRPVQEIMKKRREMIEQEMHNVDRTKKEAQELRDEYEEKLRGLKEHKVKLLEDLQGELNEERKRLISKAQEDADKIVSREKALVNEQKRVFEEDMKDKILDSVSILSLNMLRDIADEALHKAIFKKFLEGLDHCMPQIASAAGREELFKINLYTAYPLNSEDIQKIKDVVQSCVRCKVTVVSKLEPTLIAGVRITAGDRVLDSSVAGQIQALKKKLKETE
jgi:F-type H+-transporting ATPase subunit b